MGWGNAPGRTRSPGCLLPPEIRLSVFLLLSLAFFWLSLVFFSFLWFSLAFFAFLWLSSTICDFLLTFFVFRWLSLGFRDFLWLSFGFILAFSGFLSAFFWLSFGFLLACFWPSLAFFSFLWLSFRLSWALLGLFGFLWLSFGLLLLSLAFFRFPSFPLFRPSLDLAPFPPHSRGSREVPPQGGGVHSRKTAQTVNSWSKQSQDLAQKTTPC